MGILISEDRIELLESQSLNPLKRVMGILIAIHHSGGHCD